MLVFLLAHRYHSHTLTLSLCSYWLTDNMASNSFHACVPIGSQISQPHSNFILVFLLAHRYPGLTQTLYLCSYWLKNIKASLKLYPYVPIDSQIPWPHSDFILVFLLAHRYHDLTQFSCLCSNWLTDNTSLCSHWHTDFPASFRLYPYVPIGSQISQSHSDFILVFLLAQAFILGYEWWLTQWVTQWVSESLSDSVSEWVSDSEWIDLCIQ